MTGAAELFERHAVAVHAYLGRRAGTDAADDLLGEVFAVVVRRHAEFDPELGGPLPWLYAIAYRVLGAEYRSRSRRDLLTAALASRELEHAPDAWPDVDSRLDAQRLPIDELLLELPDDEREVLLLVACEDLTPTEAAAVLGIPAGTARSRLHRARAAMRQHLEDVT